MKVTKFETWWVRRDQCLFDEKRQGGSAMPWDVVVLKLTCDDGTEGIATAMAARSGQVTEGYLQETAAPLVLGRDPHDREAIFYDFGTWTVMRPFILCSFLGRLTWPCGTYVQKRRVCPYINI